MFSDELLEKVLVEPAREGANTLYIVSGYASATMASKHFEILGKLKKQVDIKLIVGMCPQDGVSQKDHEGFQSLMDRGHGGPFSCRYVAYRPAVHAKVYSWYKDADPFSGFCGSANYTQPSFAGLQREVMTPDSAQEGLAFFDLVLPDTIECTDARAKGLIEIYREPYYSIKQRPEEGTSDASLSEDLGRLPHVSLSLLDNAGELPQRSGLNWGQRPEYKRDPNQAYIRIPLQIARDDFFPEIGEHFTVLTDDGKTLICVRAQDGGKAIETPQSNSLLGEYFRYRIGLPSGAPITTQALIAYGRTDIDFYRIDEETYWMDFSVN